MDNEMLEKIMGERDMKIAPYFRGVFSLNDFLNYSYEFIQFNTKNVLVFNSERDDVADGHWLLMYFDGSDPDNKILCYFDSFAMSPGFYDVGLAKYFGNIGSTVTMRDLIESPYQIQSDYSRMCALYVVFCARGLMSKRYAGGQLVALIEDHFSANNFLQNDSKVLDWFSGQSYGSFVKEHCASNDCISKKTLLAKK
jgi:hypothetical protein